MTETAKVYGDSLYELSLEENSAAAMLTELDGVVELFRQNPDYKRLLSEPSLPRAERLGLLDEAFRGRTDPYLLNFMKLLCERGSIGELAGCARQFRRRYNQDNGILEATVTSAVALTDAQKAALGKKLSDMTGKKVDLTEKVDPSLLGGLRLDMEGQRFDGTVQNRLDKLRNTLANTVL